MLSDHALDLLSQVNGAVILLIGAVLIFAIIKFFQYRKDLIAAANRWREEENEKEEKDRQLQQNTEDIETLKQQHSQDMALMTEQQTERYNQSVAIRQNLSDKIDAYRDETKEAMNQIISTVNKIEEDALKREIDQIRYKIIRFSKELRYGDKKSQDEYNHIFQSIDKYHTLLERVQLENGQIDIESKYIRTHYLEKLQQNDFIE